eukprot:3490336-Rhodomonas_salina.1
MPGTPSCPLRAVFGRSRAPRLSPSAPSSSSWSRPLPLPLPLPLRRMVRSASASALQCSRRTLHSVTCDAAAAAAAPNERSARGSGVRDKALDGLDAG